MHFTSNPAHALASMYQSLERLLFRNADEAVLEDEVLFKSYRLVVEAVFNIVSSSCGGCLQYSKFQM